MIIMSLTMALMFLKGVPDLAVLIEQAPSITLLIAEVGRDGSEQ